MSATNLEPNAINDLNGGVPAEAETELQNERAPWIDEDNTPNFDNDLIDHSDDFNPEADEEGDENDEPKDPDLNDGNEDAPKVDDTPPDEAPSEEAETPATKFSLDGVEYEADVLKGAVKLKADLTAFEAELKEEGFADLSDAVRQGRTYNAFVSKMESPEGTAEVVNELIAHATAQWGDGFKMPASVDALQIDPSTATESEKGLLALVQHLNKKVNDTVTNFDKERKELLAEVNRIESEYKTDYAALVKADVPSAKVTSEEVRRMMKETGINDPVKAFKVANYGKTSQEEAKPAASVTAKTKKPAAIAGQGSSGQVKTYDSQRDGITLDQIEWYEAHGYTDIHDIKS